MNNVEQTWLVAHVRACIVTLIESGAVVVPTGVGDLRSWAQEVEVNETLAAVKDELGVWPTAELVARVLLASHDDVGLPVEWIVRAEVGPGRGRGFRV